MQLCSYVAMQLCSYVAMQLCSYVAMQLFSYVAMQLCSYVAMQLCLGGDLGLETWAQKALESRECKRKWRTRRVRIGEPGK
jgi:hypothetical protein